MNQPNTTVTVTIDGRPVTVKKGTTLIEAARQLGIEIPHYCYDPALSIVASCRLCLVEIEHVPKLQPSCSTPAADGQIVFTKSPKVLEARQMQMEFLLVQHPLDCPVCDQGGECKLQEYSLRHGTDDTRFRYRRRTFPKPDIGPLIDLERNRCILCSRCVRFLEEVAGDGELAVVQRGYKSCISTFQDRPLKNEFAGNTIDLCPVGALTSKVTRFRVRVWELQKKPSVCSLCSVGCNIFLEHRNRTHEVLRIEPRDNPAVNSRWICDIGRFGFDQFNPGRRATQPIKRNEKGERSEARWAEAIGQTVKKLKEILQYRGSQAVAGIIGPRPSNETLFLFQKFFREVLQSNHIDHRTEHIVPQNEDGYLTSIALRAANQPFQEIQEANAILLLGSDLPNELPILHLQVRSRAAGARIYLAHHRPTRLDKACAGVWTYRPGGETSFLAALLRLTAVEKGSPLPEEMHEILAALPVPEGEKPAGIAEEEIRTIAQEITRVERATILLGETLFTSWKGAVHVRLAAELAALLRRDPGLPLPLSLLLPHNNSRGAADMGCYPHRGPGYQPVSPPGRNTTQILEGCLDGSIQGLVLFHTDIIEEYPDRDLARRALETVPFLAVADSYEYETAKHASVFMPLSSYSEEDGTYTNVAGRIQRAEKAMPQLEGTLTGYQLLLALGERWGAPWRQIPPERVLETIARDVAAYQGVTWSGLGREGRMARPVDLALFDSTPACSLTWPRSLEETASPAYPFRLVRGRYLFDRAGEKRFAPPLVERSEACVAEIHPDDAARLGIKEGDCAILKGELGSARLPVRISAATQLGCVTLVGRYDNVSVNGLAPEDNPWITLQP
ncbi:MAG: NADH-quinone oxidoreductase subunit NuoG [bacterium]